MPSQKQTNTNKHKNKQMCVVILFMVAIKAGIAVQCYIPYIIVSLSSSGATSEIWDKTAQYFLKYSNKHIEY